MAEGMWKLIINRTRVSHFAKHSHGEEYLKFASHVHMFHIYSMYIIIMVTLHKHCDAISLVSCDIYPSTQTKM